MPWRRSQISYIRYITSADGPVTGCTSHLTAVAHDIITSWPRHLQSTLIQEQHSLGRQQCYVPSDHLLYSERLAAGGNRNSRSFGLLEKRNWLYFRLARTLQRAKEAIQVFQPLSGPAQGCSTNRVLESICVCKGWCGSSRVLGECTDSSEGD